jgi:hypothetical protein
VPPAVPGHGWRCPAAVQRTCGAGVMSDRTWAERRRVLVHCWRCMRRSKAALGSEGCQSVKPSAQPTLVRTQHLPPPAERPASWEFSARRAVSSLSQRVSPCGALDRCVAVSTDAWRTGIGARERCGGPTALDGRPRTGAATTDGPRTRGGGGRCVGLTFAVELSVHFPASARCPAGFPERVGRGRAGAVMARVGVRESVTLAGRAERARAACAFVGGLLGTGHPCGDTAVLLAAVWQKCPVQRLGRSRDGHRRDQGRRRRGPG